ncbi:MAG: phage holin, LLH family [Bacilli bacterium]|nr:phage holin, LLH family [Bacilli bacterium]
MKGGDIIEILQDQLLPIIGAVLTAIISFVGVSIRNAYTKYINTKTKKEIVKSTVEYVEQISKNLEMESAEKYAEAKEKAMEWLKEKGISINDTELAILIESAVNQFKQTIKESTTAKES